MEEFCIALIVAKRVWNAYGKGTSLRLRIRNVYLFKYMERMRQTQRYVLALAGLYCRNLPGSPAAQETGSESHKLRLNQSSLIVPDKTEARFAWPTCWVF